MSDRKAVIKNADMGEEMQQDAVDCATQALEKYNIEKVGCSIFSYILSITPIRTIIFAKIKICICVIEIHIYMANNRNKLQFKVFLLPDVNRERESSTNFFFSLSMNLPLINVTSQIHNFHIIFSIYLHISIMSIIVGQSVTAL